MTMIEWADTRLVPATPYGKTPRHTRKGVSLKRSAVSAVVNALPQCVQAKHPAATCPNCALRKPHQLENKRLDDFHTHALTSSPLRRSSTHYTCLQNRPSGTSDPAVRASLVVNVCHVLTWHPLLCKWWMRWQYQRDSKRCFDTIAHDKFSYDRDAANRRTSKARSRFCQGEFSSSHRSDLEQPHMGVMQLKTLWARCRTVQAESTCET